MKKWFLISAMVLVGVLTMPGTAAAQTGDPNTLGCDAAYYVCDAGVFGDPTAWGTGGGYGAGAFAKCHDSFGCLNCTMNEERTVALCTRVFMHNGYCSCSPSHIEQRYGAPYAVCNLGQWCTFK